MKPAGAFSLLHAARWKSMDRKHTRIKPAARISSLTERHPNLLTPRRRRLLIRLCGEQIHLRSVCRSSPSLPSCPDSTEVSNSKGSRCKKRPDPLYPQTKPPKPSKSQRGITLTTLSKHWYSTNQQILRPCIQPALILQRFPNKSSCRWRAARTTALHICLKLFHHTFSVTPREINQSADCCYAIFNLHNVNIFRDPLSTQGWEKLVKVHENRRAATIKQSRPTFLQTSSENRRLLSSTTSPFHPAMGAWPGLTANEICPLIDCMSLSSSYKFIENKKRWHFHVLHHIFGFWGNFEPSWLRTTEIHSSLWKHI